MKLGVLAAAFLAIFFFAAVSFWVTGHASLRATAVAWFHVDGRSEYYARGLRCSAAIYRLSPAVPRGALTVNSDFVRAIQSFQDRGFTALRIEGYSPRDLLQVVDLGGENDYSRLLGQALQRVRGCTAGMGRAFAAGFDRPGGTLVFRDNDTMIMVLDPVQRRLFMAKGDYF